MPTRSGGSSLRRRPSARNALSSDSEGEPADKTLLAWEREYHKYLSTKHRLRDDESVVLWWGVSLFLFFMCRFTYIRLAAAESIVPNLEVSGS